MKKKLIAFMLVGVMALSITACGSPKRREEKDAKKQEYEEIDSNAEKLNSMTGQNLYDGVNAANDYGFSVKCISANSGKDMTDYINESDDNEVKSYSITDVLAVGGGKSVTFTIANEMDMAEIKLRETLSSKIDNGHAWIALKNYGKSQFPNGFDLHEITGRISEDVLDENTWFLKATCTVTGSNGASEEFTCEANISGTNNNPEVSNFAVY